MKLFAAAALVSLSLASFDAAGQTVGLQNGGFEQLCGFCGGPFPDGWTSPGANTLALRRFVGDGRTPAISPVGTPNAITPHTGTALVSISTNGHGGFTGLTTDTINFCYCDQSCGTACDGPYPFFDPLYNYNMGDVVVTGWYMIPASSPIVGDASWIKLEVKTGNYPVATLENYASDGTGGAIVGHTNGQWVQKTIVFTRADIHNQYECNTGIQPACGCGGCIPQGLPNHVKITPSRYVGDNNPTSGTIYWDDITYTQLPAGPTCGSADFNGDGDVGTDQDIEAFFACLAGNCCARCGTADFNGDGDVGTDADIEAFFRVLAGGNC